MVLYEILKHHFEKNIHYELSSEAEDLFEEIMDNYNAQFNLKYSTSGSQISSSQPELETSECEELFVRTKAAELVGEDWHLFYQFIAMVIDNVIHMCIQYSQKVFVVKYSKFLYLIVFINF